MQFLELIFIEVIWLIRTQLFLPIFICLFNILDALTANIKNFFQYFVHYINSSVD